MKVLGKLLSAYKSVSFIDIYLVLHSIFNSLWLIYSYNFLQFIQSHNTYSRIHVRWIYGTFISSEYHFAVVHRSNRFVSYLMSVYVISSYVDIASISKLFATKINKLLLYTFLNYLVFTYLLLKHLLPEALKLYFSKFKCIYQFSDICINVRAKLVGLLWNWKKSLRGLNHFNLKIN